MIRWSMRFRHQTPASGFQRQERLTGPGNGLIIARTCGVRYFMLELRQFMRIKLRRRVFASAVLGLVLSIDMPGGAQTAVYRAPRTADGKPDLNGIWQAVSTANWDLQGHAAAKGPVSSL